MRNSNLMRDLMEETEKLAEAGDLDACMEAMSKIETLRNERTAAQAEAKRIEEEKRATHPESKLRMCEQCGTSCPFTTTKHVLPIISWANCTSVTSKYAKCMQSSLLLAGLATSAKTCEGMLVTVVQRSDQATVIA